MYWLILILLLLLMIREIAIKRININHFHIAYGILTLFVGLRQGQGQDYYNYQSLYDIVGQIGSIGELTLIYHGEIGFLFINYIAIKIGLSYEFFSALFSFITMGLYYPFFKERCKGSMIPLFFFYTTFFLIYPFSAIRQGLTLAILVSYLFPLLEQGKIWRYQVIVLLSALFHGSVLVCLCFPFIYKFRIANSGLFIIFLMLCIAVLLNIDLVRLVPQFSSYHGRTDNFYMAAILRAAMILPIFLIPNDVYHRDSELLHLRNILFFGFFIFAIFSSNDLVASRIGVYCRIFEGAFFAKVIYQTSYKQLSRQLIGYCIVISIVLFGKNINSFIQQGDYQHCTIFSYPYLSVFDSTQRIMYYRGDIL